MLEFIRFPNEKVLLLPAIKIIQKLYNVSTTKYVVCSLLVVALC